MTEFLLQALNIVAVISLLAVAALITFYVACVIIAVHHYGRLHILSKPEEDKLVEQWRTRR